MKLYSQIEETVSRWQNDGTQNVENLSQELIRLIESVDKKILFPKEKKTTPVNWLEKKIKNMFFNLESTPYIKIFDYLRRSKEQEKNEMSEIWETAYKVGKYEEKGVPQKDLISFEEYYKKKFEN